MQNRFPPLATPPRAGARALARPANTAPWFCIGLTLAMILLLHTL